MRWAEAARPTHRIVATITQGATRSGRFDSSSRTKSMLLQPGTTVACSTLLTSVPTWSRPSRRAAAEADAGPEQSDIPAPFDILHVGVRQLHQPRGMLRQRCLLGLT